MPEPLTAILVGLQATTLGVMLLNTRTVYQLKGKVDIIEKVCLSDKKKRKG